MGEKGMSMDTEDKELPETIEIEPVEVEAEIETEAPEQDDDDDIVVQIGDEEPEQAEDEEDTAKAPQWVRDLRKKSRELERENRELKAKVAPVAEVKPSLGPKPTLESCDFDSDEFETKLAAWFDDKRKADAAEQDAKAAQEAAEKAWADKLAGFEEGKKRLKVRDFEDAEHEVQTHFDGTQQGLIVQCSKDPALLAYAIGKNPKRIEQLSEIKDYATFAFELGKVEAQLKVTNRKPSTAPERTISSSARGGTGGADNTLERLREEAAKTGDFTKVMAYKRQLKG